MVQHALEDRDLSQNPKIWLQSRRIATANGTAADQFDRGLLHSQLEDFLADDDEPCRTGCFANTGIHRAGNSPARSTGESQRQAASTNEINFNLPDQDRETRGLSRAGDAAPGNAVIWRGLSRLTDIELGFALGAKLGG